MTGTAGAEQPAAVPGSHGTQLAHPAMVELPHGDQAGRGVRRLGSFLLEVDGPTLTGTQVNHRGEEVDRFSIRKRP